MKRAMKKLFSLLLVAVMLCTLFPASVFVTAAPTPSSLVVIDDSLTSEASLALFQGIGCTPELKVIDEVPVGVTMGGATSGMTWPYMLFGESSWEDYILEFTTHDMNRVGGIVRSTNAALHIDGYGGLAAMYDTYQSKNAMEAYYSQSNKSTQLTSGDPATVKFDPVSEMRYRIAVSGTALTCDITYTDTDGETQVTKTISVDTTSSGKTMGKPGLRAVFKQVNGQESSGYFSDLKVTLTGDTVRQYQKEHSTLSRVVIDDALTSETSLSLFQGFGCTPALKEIGGVPVGVTMGGATGGWPYMTFGESNWEDYTLEFTAHDLTRVGGIVRSTGAVKGDNGYGGLSATYDTYNNANSFKAFYSNNNTSAQITTGDPASLVFAPQNEFRFKITVIGTKMTCDVTYSADGVPTTKCLFVSTVSSGKTMGKAGFRTVFNQVNGTVSSGYFSDLKVTLLGDSALQYEKEGNLLSRVVVDDALTNETSLSLFQGFGCTPALKEIGGVPVGVTMGGATSAMGYPYLLFGESNWEDYTLEFTAHDMTRFGGIVRSVGAANHIDGYGGITAAYETTSLSAKYSTSNKTTDITVGDPKSVSFTATGEFRFRITVIGNKMTCDVTYSANGVPTTKSILVSTVPSSKTTGKPGLRAVFKQVNGQESSGYFSDLKLTLLGDTAAQYEREHTDISCVAINDTLTSEASLSLFQGFGCTPELKMIDEVPVGVTMGDATSDMGYPYLLFGESDWEDYTLEFTAHGMTRVGGIVRSSGGIYHLDGYGGISAAFETDNLRAIYSASTGAPYGFTSTQLKTGDKITAPFSPADEMRFRITVIGNKMMCDVSYLSGGETVTQSISVIISETDKKAGMPGLRAVFNQVNGEKASGYFSDLKVTLLGDTATAYLEKQIPIPGDLNGDREVNNTDVSILVRLLAGWEESEEVTQMADIDSNGTINNRDAIALIRTIAGWNLQTNVALDLSSATFGMASQKTTVSVSTDRITNVNPLIFGDNISWRFDGFGLWDSENDRPHAELMDALSRSGITSLRWPGGIEGDYCHWYEMIGEDRVPQLDPFTSKNKNNGEPVTSYPYFGLEEFIDVCNTLGIPAVIQLNAGNGTPEEAADLVKYCVDHNYNVSSFCVGNEMHMGEEMINGITVTKRPTDYVKFYLKTYELLGDYADKVELGCVGLTSAHSIAYFKNWDRDVFPWLAGKIDFVDAHIGYSPYTSTLNPTATDEELIDCYLASAAYVKSVIGKQLENIDKYCPKNQDNITLQITEYGSLGKASNSMAGAAYLASLLGVMTENPRITSANHFSALLIYESSPTLVGYKKENGQIRVFDNAMSPVFRWYSEQSGRSVLSSVIDCPVFDSAKCGLIPAIQDAPTAYVNTYLDEETGKGSILLVNCNREKNSETEITLPFAVRITDVSELYSEDPLASNSASNAPVNVTHFCPSDAVTKGKISITTKPVSVVRMDFTVLR